MRLRILALFSILLVACNASSLALPAAVDSRFIPSVTTATSQVPPTVTATLTPTGTTIPTATATFTTTKTPTITPTPTITLTLIPSPTVDLYPYIFPIQPDYLAGLSPGGHPYPATDIFAPAGTKYVAVTNGTVDEVVTVDLWDPSTNDPSTAGGLSVRFIGDDGMRYYGAHLSAIAPDIHPGVWVAAGQELGLVGNSGNARFGNTHVHFEISIPEPPFTKIDPYSYLTAWLKNEIITPALPAP